MKITFKGQHVSALLISTFSIIFMLTLGLFTLFYFYKGQDILFQLFGFVITGPVSLMMVSVPPLFLSIYLSFLISTYFFPQQLVVSLVDEHLEITSGKKQINIPLNEIERVFFVKRAGNWDRISIKCKRKIHLNIGTIFKGKESTEIEQLLGILKKKLTEKYGLYYFANTSTENNHSFELSKHKPKSIAKKLAINLSIAFFVIGVPVTVAIFIITQKDDGENLLHSKSYLNSNFSSDNGKVYALKMGDGYFELKGADIRTFKPLHFDGEYGSLTGKDKNSVFAVDKKIEGINVNNVQYLGLGYTKDLKNVFFRTRKISEADVV